jgi:hypothetical protein
MRFRVPVFTCVLIVAIAACGKHGLVAKGANQVTAVPGAAINSAPTPEGAPPENETTLEDMAPGTGAAAIPAALQGRWGLTPADCTSALAKAKGLLVINPGELRFYESRALALPDIQSDNQTISGNFRFSGEGKSWTRFESLKRSGDKLTRIEANPAASYTYAKC